MAGQHVCQLQATLPLAESEGVGGEGNKGTSPFHSLFFAFGKSDVLE